MNEISARENRNTFGGLLQLDPTPSSWWEAQWAKPSHRAGHKSASTCAGWAGRMTRRRIERSLVSAWPARGGAYSTASWCWVPLQYHGLQLPAGTEGQEGSSCQFLWQDLNSIIMYKQRWSMRTVLIKNTECHFHCHQMTGHEPGN